MGFLRGSRAMPLTGLSVGGMIINWCASRKFIICLVIVFLDRGDLYDTISTRYDIYYLLLICLPVYLSVYRCHSISNAGSAEMAMIRFNFLSRL